MQIPKGAFANHVLGWPGGNVAEPDPFATGVAADNRKFAHWRWHEPLRGEFHWTDNFYLPAFNYYVNPEFCVAAWRERSRATLLVLRADYRPAWAAMEDDAAWSAWVAAAIARWKPAYVEFINEPSSHGIDVAWLVRMYSLGKAAAKAVDPSIVIIGPSCESISTPGNGVEYTVSFLRAGGGAHIDALGIHLYPHGLPNHEPRSIVDQMAWLRKSIAGLWAGPIINTESGCAPEIFPTQDLTTQLRWFWQQNMLPILCGCAKSFWYAWGEDNYGPYLSPALHEIRALWASVVSFDGRRVTWQILPSGQLEVVRDDGYALTH
jgi:hypothetical protein